MNKFKSLVIEKKNFWGVKLVKMKKEEVYIIKNEK